MPHFLHATDPFGGKREFRILNLKVGLLTCNSIDCRTNLAMGGIRKSLEPCGSIRFLLNLVQFGVITQLYTSPRFLSLWFDMYLKPNMFFLLGVSECLIFVVTMLVDWRKMHNYMRIALIIFDPFLLRISLS